jgi:tetratricopeptide (TPR) repeat protein
MQPLQTPSVNVHCGCCNMQHRVQLSCILKCHVCAPQLGKYDLAIQDYTKALEVDPANSFAYYNRGITKDRMGDFEGAVADFSSAITLDPGNADFYHNRGFSLRKQVRQQALGQHSCSVASETLM